MAKIAKNTTNTQNNEFEQPKFKGPLTPDEDDHESNRLNEIDDDEQDLIDYFEN
jgi:hypothetical protein